MKSSMTFIQSNGWTEIDLIFKQKWRRFIWRHVSFKQSVLIHIRTVILIINMIPAGFWVAMPFLFQYTFAIYEINRGYCNCCSSHRCFSFKNMRYPINNSGRGMSWIACNGLLGTSVVTTGTLWNNFPWMLNRILENDHMQWHPT